tara:strand:+ start:276 stop:644 length:369 start_codon:yes stop_codon:yes gene_type:complete
MAKDSSFSAPSPNRKKKQTRKKRHGKKTHHPRVVVAEEEEEAARYEMPRPTRRRSIILRLFSSLSLERENRELPVLGRKKFLSQSRDENIISSAKTTIRERIENENVHSHENERIHITQQKK